MWAAFIEKIVCTLSFDAAMKIMDKIIKTLFFVRSVIEQLAFSHSFTGRKAYDTLILIELVL